MTIVVARPRVGALSPEHVTITLRRETDEWLDLTAISNVQLLVQKPSGELQTWNCTLAGTPTEEEATAYHLFVADDLDESGVYRLVARATAVTDYGTGPVLWAAVSMTVLGLYD